MKCRRNHFDVSHIVVSNSNWCACPSLIHSFDSSFQYLTNVSVRELLDSLSRSFSFHSSTYSPNHKSRQEKRVKVSIFYYSLLFVVSVVVVSHFNIRFVIRDRTECWMRTAHGKWHVAFKGTQKSTVTGIMYFKHIFYHRIIVHRVWERNHARRWKYWFDF